jgi:hypothetical protein
MNTEKTNGGSTPPAITSFSPARSGASSPLQWWWLFPGNRSPANDERPTAESEWSVELTLQPWVLGSEVSIID